MQIHNENNIIVFHVQKQILFCKIIFINGQR